MTYFYLFSFVLMAFVCIVLLVRIDALEGRLAFIERDHHALARKGDRVRPTLLYRNLRTGEEAYAEEEVRHD